jgi:hypothetical protein
MGYCGSVYPQGTADDVGGNTLGCRIYHADVASKEDPQIHCAHAGPLGGGVCGGQCENYCALAELHCTDDKSLYPSNEECMTACGEFNNDGAFGVENVDEDTLQCRFFYLAAAGAFAPAQNCAKAAADGGDVCVDECVPACLPGTCGMDDGCEGTCGCQGNDVCQDQVCVCIPSCDGVTCGNANGCGGQCGCPGGEV